MLRFAGKTLGHLATPRGPVPQAGHRGQTLQNRFQVPGKLLAKLPAVRDLQAVHQAARAAGLRRVSALLAQGADRAPETDFTLGEQPGLRVPGLPDPLRTARGGADQ